MADEKTAKPPLHPEVHQYFVALGRKYGTLGGHARAAALTPEEMSAISLKGLQVRRKKKVDRMLQIQSNYKPKAKFPI
jgi:hypothetical protein